MEGRGGGAYQEKKLFVFRLDVVHRSHIVRVDPDRSVDVDVL